MGTNDTDIFFLLTKYDIYLCNFQKRLHAAYRYECLFPKKEWYKKVMYRIAEYFQFARFCGLRFCFNWRRHPAIVAWWRICRETGWVCKLMSFRTVSNLKSDDYNRPSYRSYMAFLYSESFVWMAVWIFSFYAFGRSRSNSFFLAYIPCNLNTGRLDWCFAFW